MQFDRAKLRAAILHTCEAVPPDRLGAVKLHKVLYFLDMIHYAQTGSSVTGATYKKRPFGPTCVQLLPILRDMQNEGSIHIRDVDFHGLRKKEYIGLDREEAGVLNQAELDLLDEVIQFVCDKNSAKTISEYSHKLPWEMAEFGEVIPYESALLLFPVEASPEALETVEEGVEEVEAERSKGGAVAYTELSAFRDRVLSQIGLR
jgi:hypothetical protein